MQGRSDSQNEMPLISITAFQYHQLLVLGHVNISIFT